MVPEYFWNDLPDIGKLPNYEVTLVLSLIYVAYVTYYWAEEVGRPECEAVCK